MPTTRPRHTVTETEEIARALDLAARHWPQERSRGGLLVRLIDAGRSALEAEAEARLHHRQAAIRRGSAAATGLYPPGYLDELRRDWPR